MGRPASAEGYELFTDPETVRPWFLKWHRVLQDEATAVTPLHSWLEDQQISLRLSNSQKAYHGVPSAVLAGHKGKLRPAVGLNMPREPGTVDGLTQVGTDGSDKVWLFRQGWLKRSGDRPNDIMDDFEELTDLRRDFKTPSSDPRNDNTRIWFKVCELTADPQTIREQTGEFVRRCQKARDLFDHPSLSPVPERIRQHSEMLNDVLEPTGTYRVPPRDAYLVRMLHGDVVNTLSRKLKECGIRNWKPKHVGGYEGDLAVGDGRGLIFEVKTAASAGDIQTAVGQLMLYRQLIAAVSRHEPVLLLPVLPAEPLLAAVEACGITCFTYEYEVIADSYFDVRFPEEFLTYCSRFASD